MAKSIPVEFHKGIQFPPRLGSLIVKKTSEGKLAYAQNIDSSNDEYGLGSITPGPALITIDNNSELTGVPFIKAFYGFLDTGYLYFAEGIIGAKNVIRRVKDIVSGLIPSIDASKVITVDHGGHANQAITDMVLRSDTAGNQWIYISGKDDTDIWVNKMDAANGILFTPEVPAIATNNNTTGGFTDPILVLGSDNNIYWLHKDSIDSIDTANSYTSNALTNKLPLGTYATAAIDWQLNLVVAYTNDAFGDFGRRLSGGKAGVIIWDYSDANFQKRVPAPCRYISVLAIDPSGNMLVFGGIDEGKTSIYEFTGFGFNLLYTYIGDMPRSKHSVEFDGQGRICFQTADGQFCRYDRSSKVFDHLGTTQTDSSAGGLLAKAIGSPQGNEFLLASGNGSNYLMKRVSFGNYIGNQNTDNLTEPIAVSGIEELPTGSSITAITCHLNRALMAGEKVKLGVYTNGDSFIQYLMLDFAIDGAVSSKRETITIPNVDNFSLKITWEMANASTTAPAVSTAIVEIN